jgi:hypothetical protein
MVLLMGEVDSDSNDWNKMWHLQQPTTAQYRFQCNSLLQNRSVDYLSVGIPSALLFAMTLCLLP